MLQLHCDQAKAAEHKAVTQQRLQAAALDVATQQLREARKLAAWQERRIACLEGSDAHQSIARYIDGLHNAHSSAASKRST